VTGEGVFVETEKTNTLLWGVDKTLLFSSQNIVHWLLELCYDAESAAVVVDASQSTGAQQCIVQLRPLKVI